MRKMILIVLSVVLVLLSFTGCGNKKGNYDGNGRSRVLYNDGDEMQSSDVSEESSGEDAQSESDSVDTEQTANESDKKTESETKSDSSLSSSSNSSSSTSSNSSSNGSSISSSKSSSKSSSRRTTSNSTTIKSTTRVLSSSSTSSVKTSSQSQRTSSSSVSSSRDTDSERRTNTDIDSSTDTEWFDSDIQDTDSDEKDTDTENVDTDSEIEKGTLEEADLSFPVAGDMLYVGQNFDTANSILGGFNFSADISGGKIYYYNECTISTSIEDGEEEYISNITISSPNYSISKNISVGSSAEDLLRAFGDAEYGYTYTLGSRMLEFVVTNDTVTEIIFS